MWENQAVAGERILHALRDLPEDDSVNLLRRLRQNENIEDILQSLTGSGLDGIGRRGRALSDAASQYSDGSAATSSGSAQESSSQAPRSHTQQRVHFATQDAQTELPDRSRLQDRCSIGFLVNNGDDQGLSDQQQSRMKIDQDNTPSPHNFFNRQHSYPPVSPASAEARRRISAPGPMIIDSQGSTAGRSHDAYQAGRSAAEDPGTSAAWDHYYTTVSRLMKKIGEGNEQQQQL
ncbi:hypothetical protein Slin15195_G123690 [Septoria linicola]|uniref:Uncharacterized protein n=1 Tax=Septoria linicola TaxID=215465 RepID=A0A9Q9B6C5_9PEZI|nr:hypothetical protein Slin14017_G079890 [Septoria linicola]USW59050.1 hypothetical protein Slin15195_G123690 [Septoria linicola]